MPVARVEDLSKRDDESPKSSSAVSVYAGGNPWYWRLANFLEDSETVWNRLLGHAPSGPI